MSGVLVLPDGCPDAIGGESVKLVGESRPEVSVSVSMSVGAPAVIGATLQVKRFMLFAGDDYSLCYGGLNALRDQSFDSMEDAKAFVERERNDREVISYTWWQILDRETGDWWEA